MTDDQQIQKLKRSVQQLSQRMVQMTGACEAMQRILKTNGIDHPCLTVSFPIAEDPENLPELHAYEQNRILHAAGLLGGL
jgi:hypothetical protein